MPERSAVQNGTLRDKGHSRAYGPKHDREREWSDRNELNQRREGLAMPTDLDKHSSSSAKSGTDIEQDKTSKMTFINSM